MAVPERRPWRLDEFTWVVDRPGQGGVFATHTVAGAGARCVSAILDMVLQAFVAAAAVAGFWFIRRPEALEVIAWMRVSHWNVVAVLAVLGALHILYALVFELARRGRTPGKIVCGLRAVAVTGSDATPRQLILRNLLRAVDGLPGNYLLGGISTVITDYRQRLGDRIAHTLVIHELPLRDLLALSATPASAYSTSEDGYLLEAALSREGQLSEEAAQAFEARLAVYLHTTYAPTDPLVRDLYAQGNFPAYLRALYRSERSVGTYEEVPSGLPKAPPPVHD